MCCVQLSRGKLELIAWVSGGHADALSGNHLCSLHICPFLFDTEAEELPTVIIQLGEGDATLLFMLESPISILNSLGTPPYSAWPRSCPLNLIQETVLVAMAELVP